MPARGCGLLPVAIAFAVLDRLHRASALGLVLAAEGGGLLGGLVVLGWIADRLSPRTLLLGADALLAEGVAVLTGFVRTRVTELVLHAIVAGAHGVSTAMVNSALQGLIQALVPASQRQHINASAACCAT